MIRHRSGDPETISLRDGTRSESGRGPGGSLPGRLLPLLLLAAGCVGPSPESPTQEILSLRGDFDRGRDLVFESSLTCRGCHRFGTGDDRVGPDLGTVGTKFDRRKLLAKLLNPSQGIDPKYASYLVETRSGSVQNGILVERSADRFVLRDPEKTMTFDFKDIRRMAVQEKSMMPDSLVKALSAQEVADLLEFLAGLR